MDNFDLKIGTKIPFNGIDDFGIITDIKSYQAHVIDSEYLLYTVQWKEKIIRWKIFNYSEEAIINFMRRGSYFVDFQERIKERLK